MKIYFCSDTHFSHTNIIKYCKRPFSNVKEMDHTLVTNWNKKVKKDDLVFFLGDFAMKHSSEAPEGMGFEYFRNKVNGNIIFLMGNHDHNNGNRTSIESIVIKHGGKRIYLTHNPKFAKKEFIWNFCGHTHGKYGTFQKLSNKSYIIDLSVECWNYSPVDINEIDKNFSYWLKNEKNNV